MKKQYYIGLLLLITALAHGQDNNVDDLIVYRPPSEKFNAIKLQAHNELPRFGALNNYLSSGQKPTRGSYNQQIQEKQALVRTGLNNYSLMVDLKYLEPLMKDLDRERLTKLTGTMTEIKQNSLFLQNFLRNKVAPAICATDACKNAGQGKNEFERLRNYKAFVGECLDPLRKWAQALFKEDKIVGYHISTLSLGGQYDFDKNGYWVYSNFALRNVFDQQRGSAAKRVTFEPIESYEHSLKNKLDRGMNLQFLLKINADTAERYQVEGIRSLYLAKKIKLEYITKKLSSTHHVLEFKYAHESPEISIYEDAALTKLVGKLSLKNLTLKPQQ